MSADDLVRDDFEDELEECAEEEAWTRSPIRAANEDDDGYDPYSDRYEETPLFEPDPWD